MRKDKYVHSAISYCGVKMLSRKKRRGGEQGHFGTRKERCLEIFKIETL